MALAALVGCGNDSSGSGSSSPKAFTPPSNVLYIQTNNPSGNQVMAFSRDPSSGALTAIGVYDTDGTGLFNSAGALGPDDHDKEIVATSNKQYLFVANQGSGTISSFKVNSDGTLALVGSPVSSGGTQPDSLVIAGSRLYVVNRGDVSGSAGNGTGTVAGNYTGFTIGSNGSLTPIPNSTITLTSLTASPSQLALSMDGKTLFGNEFNFATKLAQIDILTINADGTLTVDGTASLPATFNPQLTLGLMTHPTQQILYTGIPVSGSPSPGVVGAWTYNGTMLTFVGQEADPTVGGVPALCWVTIDPSANYLYTASAVVNDVVGVLSISQSNATALTRIQNFTITEPDVSLRSPFNLDVDPTGKFLYTVNDCDGADCSASPVIHVLAIGSGGTLTSASATDIGLTSTHADGLVVF